MSIYTGPMSESPLFKIFEAKRQREAEQTLKVALSLDTGTEPGAHRPLSALEQAVLHLAHFDVLYHRLRSAAESVLNSRRPFSGHQEAVLGDTLDVLAGAIEEKTPQWGKIKGPQNPEADALAATIQGVIDSACHPDIAIRVISVDLAPLRAALATYHASKTPQP